METTDQTILNGILIELTKCATLLELIEFCDSLHAVRDVARRGLCYDLTIDIEMHVPWDQNSRFNAAHEHFEKGVSLISSLPNDDGDIDLKEVSEYVERACTQLAVEAKEHGYTVVLDIPTTTIVK